MKRIVILVCLVALMAGCSLDSVQPWDTSIVYSKSDKVWGGPGMTWVSTQSHNVGHYPPQSPEWWMPDTASVIYAQE